MLGATSCVRARLAVRQVLAVGLERLKIMQWGGDSSAVGAAVKLDAKCFMPHTRACTVGHACFDGAQGSLAAALTCCNDTGATAGLWLLHATIQLLKWRKWQSPCSARCPAPQDILPLQAWS